MQGEERRLKSGYLILRDRGNFAVWVKLGHSGWMRPEKT